MVLYPCRGGGVASTPSRAVALIFASVLQPLASFGIRSLRRAIYPAKGPTHGKEEATRDPEATGSPTPSPEDRGQLSHPSTSCAKDQD